MQSEGCWAACSALKYLLWHPGPVALGLKGLSSYFSPHLQTHSPGSSNTSGWLVSASTLRGFLDPRRVDYNRIGSGGGGERQHSRGTESIDSGF